MSIFDKQSKNNITFSDVAQEWILYKQPRIKKSTSSYYKYIIDTRLNELADMLVHRKLNAEQLAHHLNVSRSTITRMVADGRIPHPRKTLGGEKYWWQDEVENHIAEYKEKYGL